MLGTKHKDDFEFYWQDESDWLCIVEFLPTDNPEARLFAAVWKSRLASNCDFFVQFWRTREGAD